MIPHIGGEDKDRIGCDGDWRTIRILLLIGHLFAATFRPPRSILILRPVLQLTTPSKFWYCLVA
jgi:hypothetical protein